MKSILIWAWGGGRSQPGPSPSGNLGEPCSEGPAGQPREKGASEQELAKLLKRDLSLLADAFAFPEEEYIVFAEFPIGTGRVDFAVFSGRSWMKVTLIEIKGADFPLVTQSGYCKLSSRIEVARSQLQQRQIVLLKQYELFRRQFHALRERVQQGNVPIRHCWGRRAVWKWIRTKRWRSITRS